MKISPARAAAFDILLRIETEKAYSSVLLPLFEGDMSVQDKGLCHQIVLGVLRHQLYLDKVIGSFSKARRLDAEVLITLRIGAYQLLFLDRVPHHSAINESVNLTHRSKKSSAKPFVNAILRNIQRGKYSLKYSNEMEKLSVETSHPQWLIEKWVKAFGGDSATAIAKRNNEPPQLTFRVTSIGKRNEISFNDAVTEIFPDIFEAGSMSSGLKKAAETGEIYFQDMGSQIVGNAVNIPNNGTFLDVCAAPGSKFSQIADRHSGDLRLGVAGDRYSRRVEILRQICEKQKLKGAYFVQYDAARSLPFEYASFDAVLVDAPCSGTGTIRHNPEIRYFLSPESFAEIKKKQTRILKNASKMVKLGGELVYATCSMEMEENESVVSDFLENDEHFELKRPSVPHQLLCPDGFARTFPEHERYDGFFIASFVRKQA